MIECRKLDGRKRRGRGLFRCHIYCQPDNTAGSGALDTEREFNTDVDVAGDLDELGELNGLLGGVLEVVDGENLETGFVDL